MLHACRGRSLLTRGLVAGLAIAGLAVALLGCGDSGEAPETPAAAAPTPAPTATRAPEGPTDRTAVLAASRPSVRAAMLSIYFHARIADIDWVPREFRPLPLAQAAQIVARDRSPFAASRQRRAIARLYVAPRTSERVQALQILNAPLTDIANALPAGVASALDPNQSSFEAGTRASIQILMEILVGLLAPAPEECTRSFPSSEVDFSWTSWENTAKYSLWVERSVEALRPVLDPQNWSVCGGAFWEQSYVTIQTAGSGVVGAGGQVEKHPDPPPPGSQWNAILFERFVTDWGGMKAAFDVLLDVKTTPTPQKHLYEYGLNTSLKSVIGPITKDGGIVTDKGHVKVTVNTLDPQRTDVEALKIIKFANFGKVKDFWINFWTRIALEQNADEMYEVICCDP